MFYNSSMDKEGFIPETEDSSNAEKIEASASFEVVPRDVLLEKIRQFQENPDFAVKLLFSDQSLSGCDEGVIMEKESKLIGVATIAPKGESGAGQPSISAFYIAPEHRGNEYGGQILKRAMERCVERGFVKIRVDIMSINAANLMEKLPAEIKDKMDIHYFRRLMDEF